MDNKEESNKIVKCLIANKVNILLGAGAPKVKLNDGKIEFPLMDDLLKEVFEDKLIIGIIEDISKLETDQKQIIEQLIDNSRSNIEHLLSALEGSEMFITDVELKSKLTELILNIKKKIINRIIDSSEEESISMYADFFSQLRNLNEIKNFNNIINVFTTNYDMICEKSFENLNIHYYNGFMGNMKKVFNPTFYKYKYVENLDLNRTRYYQKKDHFNLYKLHGSFSWRIDSDGNLIEVQNYETNIEDCKLIHPSNNKFISVAMLPYYSTLLREFSNNINQEKSILITIGYGYNDIHINSLIKEALMLDQFTLIASVFSEEKVDEVLKNLGGKRGNIIVTSGVSKATATYFASVINSSIDKKTNDGVTNE